MASKLLLALSCLLLICAVCADDSLYIRGRQRGPYTVPGVGGVFDNAPGQHTYKDEQGNSFQHKNNGQDFNPRWSSPTQDVATPGNAFRRNPTAASPFNENILSKANNGFTFVHINKGAGASTHIVDGPGTRLTSSAKS
ncbi:hypothetical protein ACLKA6_006624 [Drosophila palustris]